MTPLAVGALYAGMTLANSMVNAYSQHKTNQQNKDLALHSLSNAKADAIRAGFSPQVSTGMSDFGSAGRSEALQTGIEPLTIAQQVYAMKTARAQAKIAQHDADVVTDPNGAYAGITSDSARGLAGQLITAYGAFRGQTGMEKGAKDVVKDVADKVSQSSTLTYARNVAGGLAGNATPAGEDSVEAIESKIVKEGLKPSKEPEKFMKAVSDEAEDKLGEEFTANVIKKANKIYHARGGNKDLNYDEAFEFLYTHDLGFDF